jgi:DNA-binding NtrC family response regulator
MLETAIADGKFREDLYHRLNVVTIWIPPLRERREDISRLASYFLDRFSRELGFERPPLDEKAMRMLVEHPWPGNVRELEHCIHRALIFTRGYPIQQADIASALEQSAGEAARPAPSQRPDRFQVGMTLDEVEKEYIALTLAHTGGNKKEAAKLLGISRRAIYDKLKHYGLM